MGTVYEVIVAFASLFVVGFAWMVNQDFIYTIFKISTPFDAYVPQSSTDLMNFTLLLAKWIIVVALLVILWRPIIRAQSAES